MRLACRSLPATSRAVCAVAVADLQVGSFLPDKRKTVGTRRARHVALRENDGACRARVTRHLFFGALAFAEEGFEGVGAGEVMEQALAILRIHWGGEEFSAFFAQLFEPGFVFGTELLFELFAEALRKRRALAGGGDGDLECAALCHGGIVEVAKLGNVNDVAQHAAVPRLGGDVSLQFGVGCGDDNEEHSVEIGWLARTREPFEFAVGSPGLHLRRRFRSYDANGGLGVEEA